MPKNIILLFDGTWNSSIEGHSDTNIHHLKNSISKDNQVKFYYTGVGENIGKVNRILWGVTGKGVFMIARRAWNDVSGNYEPGDKIFIFGFSRGAFVARHLAGMIIRYGVVGFGGNIETNYREYMSSCMHPSRLTRTPIHFLGLFDCVPGNYLYLLRDRSFHLNSPELEDGILNFRHAVSLDERRYSFRPIIFRQGKQESFFQHWFSGYHSDVGGNRDNSRGLASYSLWWMMREAFGLGLNFNNIVCPLHLGGSNLSIIQSVDPDDMAVCSDYWTTRIGIRWTRSNKENSNIPSDAPKFEDLDSCPRCGNPMFDYFQTQPGRKWLSNMKMGTPGKM